MRTTLVTPWAPALPSWCRITSGRHSELQGSCSPPHNLQKPFAAADPPHLYGLENFQWHIVGHNLSCSLSWAALWNMQVEVFSGRFAKWLQVQHQCKNQNCITFVKTTTHTP